MKFFSGSLDNAEDKLSVSLINEVQRVTSLASSNKNEVYVLKKPLQEK